MATVVLLVLGVSGCVESGEASRPTESVTTQQQAAESSSASVAFADFPMTFGYANPAEGWSTTLMVSAKGRFTGHYNKWATGEVGPDFPNGTQYVCDFAGKFVEVKPAGDSQFSMRVEGLRITSDPADPKNPTTEGVRTQYCEIGSDPVGFTSADEFLLFRPAKKVAGLPEGYVAWVFPAGAPSETLGFYGLYNVAGNESFRGGNGLTSDGEDTGM